MGAHLLAFAAAFGCQDAAQCGDNAFCETNGFCSFPDAECPSGRRYGEHAPTGLAGACVDPVAGTEGSSGPVVTQTSTVTSGADDTTSTSAVSMTSDATTTDATDATLDTGATDSDGSSGTGRPGELLRNYAFVTSVAVSPDDIGGLEGGDTLCQSLAEGAGLPGTYVAWLSTPTADAIDSISATQGGRARATIGRATW